MALINRVSRLFKADLHAVLDQIEEPEQILRQAVRDMEAELAANEQSILRCSQEQDALRNRLQALQPAAKDIGDQLDLCFSSGKDDLAKTLIRKKLEAERVQQQLSARHTAGTAYLEEQRTRLEHNKNTLESLRQKAEVFALRRPSASSQPDWDDTGWMTRELNVAESDVVIAFLREKSLRSIS